MLGWTEVGYLMAQPFLLAAGAVGGFLCYRRFTRLRFVIALGPLAFALTLLAVARAIF